MAGKTGDEGVLYRNVGGTYEAPNWVEMSNVRDVNLGLEKNRIDMTTRANNGWRANKGGLKDLSIETEIVWDPEDTHFDALLDSFLNGTALDLLVLDGPVTTSGSKGFRFQGEVFSFSRNEPRDDAMTASVTIAPTYSPDHPPELYEVSA